MYQHLLEALYQIICLAKPVW